MAKLNGMQSASKPEIDWSLAKAILYRFLSFKSFREVKAQYNGRRNEQKFYEHQNSLYQKIVIFFYTAWNSTIWSTRQEQQPFRMVLHIENIMYTQVENCCNSVGYANEDNF